MKRKKSFLKKITLLFVLFFLIHVGHWIMELLMKEYSYAVHLPKMPVQE